VTGRPGAAIVHEVAGRIVVTGAEVAEADADADRGAAVIVAPVETAEAEAISKPLNP